jgi:orotate phosphoribosyltransferase
MTRSELAARIRAVSQLSGSFVLRSGARSDIYFDKFRFESNPVLLRAIAEQMAPLVPAGTDVLAGIELGGIPLVTVLSQVTGLPAAFVRKAPKTYGTCKYAEGADLDGVRVLLVEDVVSSGGAILDTAAMMRNDGIVPEAALCVVDRETGGAQALRAAGISLRALFTMREIEGAAPEPMEPGR